ncbi:MAG: hypothetical protein GY803_06085 [Chloroflexi bacterium]|nr:hypothetical protein [Chloroflexota bacterium]
MTRRKPRKLRVPRRQAMAEKWRPLYEAADRIKELGPWQWMREDEIFGVQNPENGEIGFVSVMGKLGEHLSITVYLGVDAINQFWSLEDVINSNDEWEIANRLLIIPQIQASFENRDMVEKEDAGIMRRLNLKYHGRNAYPTFRYIKPGCPHWFLETEQIPFLLHVMNQTENVTSRYKNDKSLLYPEDVDNHEMYLLRVPEEQDGKIVWRDEIEPIPKSGKRTTQVDIDLETFEALQNTPRVGNSVEIDLFLTMTPIQEKRGERPYFPFTLLIVDADSGIVLSHGLLSPLPSIDKMYSKMPQKVIDLLLDINMLPYEVFTQSFIVTQLLSSLFEQLDTPLIELSSLPMLNEAKAAMKEYANTGFR